jgi:transposase
MVKAVERQFMSPPQVAELLGVGVAKIHYWITAGELVAVNLATDPGKRPRWGVKIESIDQFQKRRASILPSKAAPRKPRQPFATRKFF